MLSENLGFRERYLRSEAEQGLERQLVRQLEPEPKNEERRDQAGRQPRRNSSPSTGGEAAEDPEDEGGAVAVVWPVTLELGMELGN